MIIDGKKEAPSASEIKTVHLDAYDHDVEEEESHVAPKNRLLAGPG